ncbi:MAG: tetratricopeptide repeat protein [Bacteroidota bacterium]
MFTPHPRVCSLLFALLLGASSVGCQSAEETPSTFVRPALEETAPSSVVSLFGDTLTRPPLSARQRTRLMANLDTALTRFDAAPDEAESFIWLGRRLAYLWRYQAAIEVFTAGLEVHPLEPRLYRHRGHRYITVRAFEEAEADYAEAVRLIEGTADTVEPDGAPNAAGIPRSTLHTNIWYHQGLAYYLQGQFAAAREAFQRCLEASPNDDMRVAAADWLYMSLRRLGDEEAAAEVLTLITPEMDLLENQSYHRRLRMYQGAIAPEALLTAEEAEDRTLTLATQGYGVANWYLVEGDTARALAVMETVLQGDYWAAFGYIAAEADVHRLRGTERPGLP